MTDDRAVFALVDAVERIDRDGSGWWITATLVEVDESGVSTPIPVVVSVADEVGSALWTRMVGRIETARLERLWKNDT